jgi:hypothetical protein
MAYSSDENAGGLDILTTLATGDLHIVGDISDANRAKVISENNLEVVIANSTNFVDELVQNAYFTTTLAGDSNFQSVLAGDSNFVTLLTSDTLFQTLVNNFAGGGGSGGGGGGKPMTFSLPNTDGIPAGFAWQTGYSDREALIYRGTSANLILQDAQGNTQLRNTATDWADSNDISGYALIGAYLYAFLVDGPGTELRVYRYTATDLSLGGTLITIAGQALGTEITTVMTSNGTDFYFNFDGGTSANEFEIAKYSISGTTLTYVSTVTCGASGSHFDTGFAVNNSGDIYGFASTITRYNSSGTLQDTAPDIGALYIYVFNWDNTFYTSENNATDSLWTKVYLPNTDDSSEVSESLSMIPQPAFFSTDASLSTNPNANTEAHVGKLVIPSTITVSNITISVTTVTVAGTLKIALFSDDGLNKLFEVTTANISGTGNVSTAVTPTTIAPGTYYLMVMSVVNATDVSWRYYKYNTALDSLNDPATFPIISGLLSGLTAGTIPTTFDPTTMTALSSGLVINRLDA